MEQCGAGQLVEAGQTGQGKGPFEVWTTAHIVWWSWRRPQTSISGLAFDRELANHLGMDGYAPGPQGCPDTVHPVRQADAIVQVPTNTRLHPSGYLQSAGEMPSVSHCACEVLYCTSNDREGTIQHKLDRQVDTKR